MTARKILVSGGSGSIGSVVTQSLLEMGHEVAFTFLHASSVVDRLGELGAQPIRVDFRDEAELVSLDLGSKDAVVHCAGINISSAMTAETSLSDWDQTFAVNVRAAFVLARDSLAGMIARHWGRQVFVGSIYSIRGSVQNAPYNASKHALSGLMKSIAKEYGADGVTSNEVLPAAAESKMMDRLAIAKATAGETAAQYLQRVASASPRNRLVQPREVADLVSFLITDGAAGINGASIPMDGGQIA